MLSGLAVARLVFAGERPLVRVWLGCVAALVMLLWFPALWAFCIGFTAAAQLLALVTAAGAGCACYLLARRRERLRAPWLAEAPLLYTLLPLFVLGVVLLFDPFAGATAMTVVMGVMLVLDAAADIWTVVELRGRGEP